MPKKPLDLIVAYDRNRGIGKNGQIPWNIPADLKRFSEITKTTQDPSKQNAVIMGRKTWESIPAKYRPLPGRRNVVLSLSQLALPGATVASGFHSALRIADNDESIERVFVIGGAEVYVCAMVYVECIYATELDIAVDCDVYFPFIDEAMFNLEDTSAIEHYCGIDFTYKTYRRVA